MSVWHRSAMLEQLRGELSHAPSAEEASAPISVQSEPSVHASAPIAKDDPLYDHAKDILEEVATTDAPTAADTWDAYHTARTPADLKTRLQALPIPPHIAARLIEAKDSSQPKDVVDKILTALMKIPKQTLDIAETHPRVLEHFTKAVRGKD